MEDLIALLMGVDRRTVLILLCVALGTTAVALLVVAALTPSNWRKLGLTWPSAPTPTPDFAPLPDLPERTVLHNSNEIEELENLRLAGRHVPIAAWRRDRAGQVVWANRAYIDLISIAEPGAEIAWPLPDLFAELLPINLPAPPSRRRGSLKLPDDTRRWFDLTCDDVEDGTFLSATAIDGTVHAEDSLRSYLQTLTGTFAHLKTGLAIFDKRRQLIMFNPAFIDLTGLEPAWLTNRPVLSAVFDRLRDRNALPEPRDYKGWRDRMAALDAVPNRGIFEETWNLPNGQTFKVAARPHHEGGIAFLIEDISAEVGSTRKFRTELEMCQSVIDALDDAIVVFSQTGHQLMTNRAYRALWGLTDGNTDTVSVVDANRLWQSRALPDPLWGEIRDFVGTQTHRSEWSDHARLGDGSSIGCRVIPMSGGATLIAFERAEPLPVFHRHTGGLRAVAS